MESLHPDERPAKKRRFFTEDSSPAQVRSKPPSPPPQTPPPAGEHDAQAQAQPEEDRPDDTGAMDGFDVGMLQAVVGELSAPTLLKLKDVSGNNVERGVQKEPTTSISPY
jgi:DNA repair protein RAD5